MNVLITREEDKAEKFANMLRLSGHTPFLLSMIKCVPEKADIQGAYDFGIFTSLNAVTYFQPYKNMCKFGKIAAVGTATAKALEDSGMSVDLIPDEFSAEGLKRLFSGIDVANKKFLLAGAETRAGDFHSWLESKGCVADIVTIYKTVEIERKKEDVDSFLTENSINVVTFASPSAVRAFFKVTDTEAELVAIGRTTADEIKKYGRDCLVPKEYTLKGMTEIINKLK